MNAKGGGSKEPEHPLAGHATVSITTGAAFLTTGSAEGEQQIAYSDIQIRVETEAHRRRIEQQRLDHELQEESKDNSARRTRENVTFGAFIGTPIAGLIFAAALSVWTADEETRQFAHNLIALIFGGILGGLTGYFTGRSTK